MSRSILIPLMLVSWGALAQVPPPPDVNHLPTPPVVTLTPEETETAQAALEKLGQTLMALSVPDTNTTGRVGSIRHGLAFSQGPVDPTSMPIIGMALSRNSQDPKACALLQRIEPSAVCVK